MKLRSSDHVGVKGIDPTGNYFDDTHRDVDSTPSLSAADKQKVFKGKALKIYSGLKAQIGRTRKRFHHFSSV